MDAFAALALQLAWGADEALGPAPRDRRSRPSHAEAAVAPAPNPPVAPVPPPITSGMVSCEAVDAAWRDSGGAGLAVTARHFVGRRGADDAAILILGDRPGEAEERSGVAFDGPAGALLMAMLASAGIPPAAVAFGYVVPWRPPGGRPPTELEVAACVPFLRARLALCPPRITVPCATLATRCLLGATRSRGQVTAATVGDLRLPCLPIQSPEQAMATASAKARMWASMRLLRRTFDGTSDIKPVLTGPRVP